jgi:hypothetical protein
LGLVGHWLRRGGLGEEEEGLYEMEAQIRRRKKKNWENQDRMRPQQTQDVLATRKCPLISMFSLFFLLSDEKMIPHCTLKKIETVSRRN